ncbi:protein lethal(2)essential for life-like [Copidosoma floridanum]|uniref:protein lethal(2)essential for life-like n=1 Tax=Copidosoma floridanum TaxID=29053 RepID=UPI0006C9DB94|nr:protein lethal(2)essential for life-like [Copidosoma floridanum]
MINEKTPNYTEEEVLADIEKVIRDLLAPRSLPRATSNNKKLVLPIHQNYGDNSPFKVKAQKEDFYKEVDCTGFAQKEIYVFVEDKLIVVEGIHKNVQDEHGIVYKNLSKTFPVSENYDFNDAQINLVSDGTSTIYIPRKVESLANEDCGIKSLYKNKPTKEIQLQSEK